MSGEAWYECRCGCDRWHILAVNPEEPDERKRGIEIQCAECGTYSNTMDPDLNIHYGKPTGKVAAAS